MGICGVAVNKISACGVAVISNLMVCDVCILRSAVFSGTKLSAMLQYPDFKDKLLPRNVNVLQGIAVTFWCNFAVLF